ncbi:VTC domain-containing protein [Desulfofustis glycolicus]|uniref:VTC domain-containing protein n=1 Tax=Desulfofustis glycolicus DSM 9705 TaxID=1121409 RepID=A0A1M5UWM8_9BACT|nr:VTC domain-containing protein [Desulfofustis glycolicus]MCB2215889.1 VTC domain-containing protein [Desulfobulbaceae bacterium]SHH67133.1 VTC domain-containing protein [Desulfofustis glycolicus DSM 9705]
MVDRETKFTHSSYVTPGILRCLQLVCQPDDKYQKNVINSIYFDTHDYRFAMEKAASDYLKTKVRLRWYQDPSGAECEAGCFLEIKQKIGSMRKKKRIHLELDTNRLPGAVFDTGILSPIRKTIRALEPELSIYDLTPQVLVSYTRYRFVDPVTASRIALDTEIKAKSSRSRFRRHAGEVWLKQSVLEVKGFHQELPRSLRAVLGMQVKKDSFSKYYECFRRLYNYHQ